MTTDKMDEATGIYLEFKETPIPTKYHAYLVYRDGRGGEQVLRGGPDMWFTAGNIESESLPLEESKDAYSDGAPKSDRLIARLPIAEENLNQAWDAMEMEERRIKRAGYDYDADQNSNSAVAAMMKMMGLNMKDHLPKELKPEQVPGMENTLDHEPEPKYENGPETYDSNIWGDGGDPNPLRIEKDWQRKTDPLADPTIIDPPGPQIAPTPTDGVPKGAFFNGMPPTLAKKLLATSGPAEDVLSRPLSQWGEGDVRAVMIERMQKPDSDPEKVPLAVRERGWFDTFFGTAPAKRDATGRLSDTKPKKSPPLGTDGPAPVLGIIGKELDDVAKKKGEEKAVTGLQSRLNTLREETKSAISDTVFTAVPTRKEVERPVWPHLKEDGVLGPKTRRATKMAAGTLGNGLLSSLEDRF